jgi:hypothetical protein
MSFLTTIRRKNSKYGNISSSSSSSSKDGARKIASDSKSSSTSSRRFQRLKIMILKTANRRTRHRSKNVYDGDGS